MYNKRKFNKINDKKVLHKVKKQWVTISLALFMLISGGAVATHVSASADSNNNNQGQQQVQLGSKSDKRQPITNQPQLHKSNRTVPLVNNHSAKKINNINQLKPNQSGNYQKYVYERINVPFNIIRVNKPIRLHSSVNFDRSRIDGTLPKGQILKINRAFKEFGFYSNYLRYEVRLANKRNAFITGDKNSVSYVILNRNYKYYQNKINNLLKHANNKKTIKLAKRFNKLNRQHNHNLNKYVGLYELAYNVQQNQKHPVVVNYHNRVAKINNHKGNVIYSTERAKYNYSTEPSNATTASSSVSVQSVASSSEVMPTYVAPTSFNIPSPIPVIPTSSVNSNSSSSISVNSKASEANSSASSASIEPSSKASAKPSSAVKPSSSVKPNRSKASVKPSSAVRPSSKANIKPSSAAKPDSSKASTKPSSAVKPSSSVKPNSSKASVKPSSAVKPSSKASVKPSSAAKPDSSKASTKPSSAVKPNSMAKSNSSKASVKPSSTAKPTNSKASVIPSSSAKSAKSSSVNVIPGSKASAKPSSASSTTSSSANSNAVNPVSANIKEIINTTFSDINNERKQNGVAPLSVNSQLQTIASMRANQLTKNFSHYNNKGQSYDELDAEKVAPEFVGDIDENISWGNLTNDYMIYDEEQGVNDKGQKDPIHYVNHNGNDIANMMNDAMMNWDANHGDGHRTNILDSNNVIIGLGVAYNPDNQGYYLAEDFSYYNGTNPTDDF